MNEKKYREFTQEFKKQALELERELGITTYFHCLLHFCYFW